ncbi:hypothetical protein L7F22_053343 [Adiantum nelumboides]|nr:hypothetical protein [Adiantum nelumboides]
MGSLASTSHIHQAETHVPIQPPQLPEMPEFQGTEEEEQLRPAPGALDIREKMEQEIEDLPEGPAKEYLMFVNAVSVAGVAGVPITPTGSEVLRTSGLTRQVDIVDEMLGGHKESWALYGCTIISDGWKDVQKHHLLNILVSCCIGTTFLRAIDVSSAGIWITGELVYGHIRDAVEEVGPQHVVQVVTDNASNCKLIGETSHTRVHNIELRQIGWNTYVERIYGDNGHMQNQLEEDFLEYRGGKGNFSHGIAKDAENQALLVSWWEKIGGLNSALYCLALLNTPQLDRLAFVNANLQVLEKAGGLEGEGPISWLPKKVDHWQIVVEAADVS